MPKTAPSRSGVATTFGFRRRRHPGIRHWKAKVIVFGLFGKPLVGEYLHGHLKSCAQDSDCRPVLELITGGSAASGSGAIWEAWKKDLRYAWLFWKESWLLLGGQQIVSSYLTLYKADD